jgi:hypothetical protein
MSGKIQPTDYTADIVRRQKTGAEEEDNIGERRLMVGRVYL